MNSDTRYRKQIMFDLDTKMGDISNFIQGIPEKVDGIPICSDIRKKVYVQSMEMKLEQFLMPVYEKAKLFLQGKENCIVSQDKS